MLGRPFYFVLLAAALCAGCALSAPPSAPDEGQPGDVSYGVIESIGEAPLAESPFEHPVRPEIAEEVRVRLDDGGALTVVQDAPLRLAAGQRVVVIRERRGARIESVLPM